MEEKQKNIKLAIKILGFIGLPLVTAPHFIIYILSLILKQDISYVYQEYSKYIFPSIVVILTVVSILTIYSESLKTIVNKEVVGKSLFLIFLAFIYSMTKAGLGTYANILFWLVVVTIIIYKLIEVRRNIDKRERETNN